MVKSLETNNLSPACNGVTSEFEPAAPEETSVSLLKDGSNTFLFSMSAGNCVLILNYLSLILLYFGAFHL